MEKELLEKINKVSLLEERQFYSVQELESMFPNKKIFACDFAIKEINDLAEVNDPSLEEIAGGYCYGNVINIDHHAPNLEMARNITSTQLASEYIRQNEKIQDDSVVLINHLDTDSTLSSAIMSGFIKPEKMFSEAALSSDHYGNENELFDLLDSIQSLRDLGFSYECLYDFINKKALPDKAEEKLKERKELRKKVKELVQAGMFEKIDMVYFALSDQKIPLELFLPYYQQAAVLMLAIPIKNKPNFYEIKIRLGPNAPKGLILNQIKFSENDDFGFRGRWNAGSNKRIGGTNKSPRECLDILNKYLKNYINQ